AQPVAECDTDGSTAVLTGCDDTADIAIGMLVTVSDGFPSMGPYLVTAKTSSTLTLDTASDAMESDVTVTGLVDESGNAYFNPAVATSDLCGVATASSQGGSIVWDTGLGFIYTPEMGES